MSSAPLTAYQLDLRAAHREAQAIREATREAKYARARVLLADGLPLRDIAARLGISVDTVRKLRRGEL